jgi:acetoin utilization protein AcuB
MLAQDIMQHPVITIEPGATIDDAYRRMRARSIRHLPVVDDGDGLVGIVTDRDLRFATSDLHPSPLEARDPVRSAMTENPITAGLLDPVEEAARILRTKSIGCLPVLDGDALVGIITVTNLLDAVIRLTGLQKPGARLAVSLPDEPGQLSRLTGRVAEEGLDIRSVLSYYEDEVAPALESQSDGAESRLRVILRLDTMDIRPLAEALREESFDVVWPVPKPV